MVIPPELKALQYKYFGEAIANLITQKTPKEIILRRQGRGGSYDYVPIYWFVPQLNALFGFLWDIVVDDKGILNEDIEVEIEDPNLDEKGNKKLGPKVFHTETKNAPTQVWVQGHLTIKKPGVTTIEKFPDGRVLETRIDPIEVTKHAFGGTDIKVYKDGSGIIDIGDDFKGATADMIKKAASYLGMCADVYGRREVAEETGPSDSQMKALLRKGVYLGGTEDNIKEKIGKMCEANFQCGLDSIDTGQFIRLMKLLTDGSRPKFAVKPIVVGNM